MLTVAVVEAVLNVTLPPLWVNVPLLVKLPEMVSAEDVAAKKAEVLPMVILPLTLIGVLLAKAFTVAGPETEKLLLAVTAPVAPPPPLAALKVAMAAL